MAMQGVGEQVIVVVSIPFFLVSYILYANFANIKKLFRDYLHKEGGLAPAGPRRAQYGGGECAICLNQPKRLQVSGTCGHSFCGPCLLEIFDRRDDQIYCPLCRNPITTVFRNFPEGIDDPQSQQIIISIVRYNTAFADDRSWYRRLMEFPYVWRMVRRGLFNPRFILYFIRSAFFFRWIMLIIVYLLMPLDIIPEKFFGFIGLIDDFLIAIFVLIFMLSVAAVTYMRIREG